MTNSEAKILLQKYEDGECTEQEMALLESWFIMLKSGQDPHGLSDEAMDADLREVWLTLKGKHFETKKVRLWPRIAVAAAAVAAIVSGVWFFNYRSGVMQHSVQNHELAKNDIPPGKQGATLTLANGRKIKLSEAANGEIAKEAGISISKTADGQVVYKVSANENEPDKINTLSTAKGETYMLTLPDQTKVWLNSASSLTYTAVLMDRGRRKVKLAGEAYFQVAKDHAHPFIVESRGQEVEVLGTQFNVNAYADEPATITTLLEGSVRLTAGTAKKLLKPGQQALNEEGNIKISAANLEKATDWKTGEFYVNHIDFKTAMRKISRWYDVEIIYNSSVPEDMEIGGWISRNEKLSSVLKSIESAGLVHFKIDGRKIYVSK